MYILGINLPDKKLVHIALQSIYGIGKTTSLSLCHSLEIHPLCRLKDLPEQKVTLLSQRLNAMPIDTVIKKQVSQRIQELYDIGTWRGKRHAQGFPVKGQRTHTNASTAKRLNGRVLKMK